MTKEEIYDSQISPLMTQVIGLCKANQIAANIVFELDRDAEQGETWAITNLPVEPESALMRMLYYLSLSKGNLDLFIIACKRDAEQHGHSSAILQILKTPAGERTQGK